MLLALALSTAGWTPGASAQRLDPTDAGQLGITRTVTYAANANQGRQALDWVRAHALRQPPRLPQGEVTITRTLRIASADAAGQAYAASSEFSPMPLPTGGVDGERYTIEHTLPDGSREFWVFEWRSGGGWDTVEYGFRDGAPGNSRPSPGRELR